MSKMVGVRVDKPRVGAPSFVEGRCGATREFAEWIIANLNDRGWVNWDILRSKEGDLYFKHNEFKPKEPQIQSVDRERYSVSSKTDQPLDDDIPF